MKVSELIEALSKIDPDLPICVGLDLRSDGIHIEKIKTDLTQGYYSGYELAKEQGIEEFVSLW